MKGVLLSTLLFLNGFATLSAVEKDASLLIRDLVTAKAIDLEVADRLPFHYNYNLTGGYWNMPSARMNKAGVVAGGFSFVPPYRNYGVTVQALDRLEFGINYRVFYGLTDPGFKGLGFGDLSDRGANLKVSLGEVGSGIIQLPELAVGCEDFYGSKRFHSFYMVATQSFLKLNCEATIGWGKGRVHGLFGGVIWTPFRQSMISGVNRLGLIAEWDAINYKHHAPDHEKGRDVRNRVNVGLTTTFFDTLQLSMSSVRGEELAFSASIHRNLGESEGLFPKTHDPDPYLSPLDLEPLGLLRSEEELAQELSFAFSGQRLNLYTVYLTRCDGGKRALWMKVVNNRYREAKEVKERIENILMSLLPDNIECVTVVIEEDGVMAYQYQFRSHDLRQFRERTIGEFELDTLSPQRDPTSAPSLYDGTQIYHRTKPIWTLTVRPRLLSFFGSVTGKYKYSFGLIGGTEGYLFDNVCYKIQGAYNIASTSSEVGDMDRLNPSQLPNVRSDSVRYYEGQTLSLEQAFIQKGLYLKKGWYGRLAAGYFESAYGGIAAEFLYYPAGQSWAIGFEGAGVLKRNYRGLGFTTQVRQFEGFKPKYIHFIGYQYFLDLYYDWKPMQVDFKVSIGKFLARDYGAQFDIGRYFKSGFRFSVWYDWTSATDIVNGSRYRNKGIAFVIPLDMFLTKSSRSNLGYAVAVSLRDAGARAATGKRLYPTLFDSRS